MPQQIPIPRGLQLPAELALLITEAAVEMAQKAHQAYRIENRGKRGATLRPGKETPLWNELRAQLQPHLRRYGDQVNLGRVLGLPRQRINAYITLGSQMPDAERTLQMLAWLIAARRGQRPG
jgi:hypothetical protein